MPGASSKIDAEILRVQNEIKALDRSISAQQQQRNALSTNLDSLLAAKEKSDMLASSFLLLRIQATYYVATFLNACICNFAFSQCLFTHFLFLTVAVCREAVSSRIGAEREWGDAHGFPWSPTLQSMLRECFRLSSFRPGQIEAINCVRASRIYAA